MTAHLYIYGISYFSVPKNACSTLKNHIFQVENGVRFGGFMANSLIWSVHNIYPSRPFKRAKTPRMAGHWKFAVIRDPIERLASVHADKVMDGKWLQRAKFSDEEQALGMHGMPDFGEFARHLPRYLEHNGELKRHALPQSDFLGEDAGYFDRLYRMDEISVLEADLAARIDVSVPTMGHENKSRRSGIPEISALDLDAAKAYYAADYTTFGAYF